MEDFFQGWRRKTSHDAIAGLSVDGRLGQRLDVCRRCLDERRIPDAAVRI